MADDVFYDGPAIGLYALDRFKSVMLDLYPGSLKNEHQDRNMYPPLWRSLSFFDPESELDVRYFVQGVNGSSEAMAWANAPEQEQVDNLLAKLKKLE